MATIKAGEKLEYGAGDNHGAIYVAGVANGDLVKVDANRNSVVAHWPRPAARPRTDLRSIPEATERSWAARTASWPSWMRTPAASSRCSRSAEVTTPSHSIGEKKSFSLNGRDGTITVYQQQTPDNYAALAPIHTVVSGRTMAVDSKQGGCSSRRPTPNRVGRPVAGRRSSQAPRG